MFCNFKHMYAYYGSLATLSHNSCPRFGGVVFS